CLAGSACAVPTRRPRESAPRGPGQYRGCRTNRRIACGPARVLRRWLPAPCSPCRARWHAAARVQARWRAVRCHRAQPRRVVAASHAVDREARRSSSYTIPCYTFVLMSRLSALLGTLVCAVVLFAACSEPPKKEIDQAQQAVDAARQAGAEQYAAEAFAAATAALQQAREAVDQRDYRLALSRAVDAGERAHEATTAATDNKAKAR